MKGNTVLSVLNSTQKSFKPSMKPKFTARKNLHKIDAQMPTYALTFRGSWSNTWQEFKNNQLITLTHGRKEI